MTVSNPPQSRGHVEAVGEANTAPAPRGGDTPQSGRARGRDRMYSTVNDGKEKAKFCGLLRIYELYVTHPQRFHEKFLDPLNFSKNIFLYESIFLYENIFLLFFQIKK